MIRLQMLHDRQIEGLCLRLRHRDSREVYQPECRHRVSLGERRLHARIPGHSQYKAVLRRQDLSRQKAQRSPQRTLELLLLRAATNEHLRLRRLHRPQEQVALLVQRA
jgi:hypothetical protein